MRQRDVLGWFKSKSVPHSEMPNDKTEKGKWGFSVIFSQWFFHDVFFFPMANANCVLTL